VATESSRPDPQAGRAEGRRLADITGLQPGAAGADLAVQGLAAVGLRVLAAAGVLGGLAASVLFWILASRYALPWDWLRGSLAAAIALQVLFLAALAAWAVLTWRRARQIGALRPPDYPVITCVAACTRLLGELCAVAILAASLGLAVATLAGQPFLAAMVGDWLGGAGALPPWAIPTLTLLSALLWPLAGLAFAGGFVFAAYLVAELMSVMLDYVRDVRRIREAAEAARDKEPGSPNSAAP
jgi:hypothetical protein